jgi:cytochrome c oxidase assembly protein subunit 15
MNFDADKPLVHRVAVITASVALLPIAVGAIVTTIKAGMAFPDWPTSDGHNMLSYPWLQSAGDQFAEHGHRLAGMLAGLASILLVIVSWMYEPRRWVRWAAVCVLLGVIVQGILGGYRVRLETQGAPYAARVIAMLHGSFGAVVFAYMCSFALATSRSWRQLDRSSERNSVRHLKPLVLLTSLLILAQYVVGGTLRHFGMSLYEHIGLAVLVLMAVVAVSVAAVLSHAAWLRKPAWLMLGLVVVQILLGCGAFVGRFGFAPAGYVAVQDSKMQVFFCTAHTVTGLLLFGSAVVLAVSVFRLDSLQRATMSFSREPQGERSILQGPVISDAAIKGAAT